MPSTNGRRVFTQNCSIAKHQRNRFTKFKSTVIHTHTHTHAYSYTLLYKDWFKVNWFSKFHSLSPFHIQLHSTNMVSALSWRHDAQWDSTSEVDMWWIQTAALISTSGVTHVQKTERDRWWEDHYTSHWAHKRQGPGWAKSTTSKLLYSTNSPKKVRSIMGLYK